MNFKIICFFCSILFLLHSCGEEGSESLPNQQVQKKEVLVKFASPNNQAQYVSGQMVTMKIKLIKPESIQGNVKIFLGDSMVVEKKPEAEIDADFMTRGLKVGRHLLTVKVENKEGKTYADTRNIIIFSDIQPLQQEITIKDRYPHNTNYYTQGLEFDDRGNLVEGTGQKGSSLIAVLDYATGQVKLQQKLEKFYFGEGITILNGKIYQITYQAGKCFVYDAQTLKRLNEFNYTGEGWGLCNDGKSIYMSNGSSILQKRDPETFDVISEIHVMDNQQELVYLNELEYFEDKIYANIYQQNVIAEIDPTNGKVTAYIDCSKAYNEVSGSGIDVLNGIAYQKETGRIFITGKWWPKLFEVSFDVKM